MNEIPVEIGNDPRVGIDVKRKDTGDWVGAIRHIARYSDGSLVCFLPGKSHRPTILPIEAVEAYSPSEQHLFERK